jgi:hypothetical protein
VGSQGAPQFLGRASPRGEGVETVVKGPAAGKGNLRQQVFLAVDVRVNGALVQAKSAGEIADGGPVIPLLSELSRGSFAKRSLVDDTVELNPLRHALGTGDAPEEQPNGRMVT